MKILFIVFCCHSMASTLLCAFLQRRSLERISYIGELSTAWTRALFKDTIFGGCVEQAMHSDLGNLVSWSEVLLKGPCYLFQYQFSICDAVIPAHRFTYIIRETISKYTNSEIRVDTPCLRANQKNEAISFSAVPFLGDQCIYLGFSL